MSLVVGTQFKIILDENRESCDYPIDCQTINTVNVQKSMKDRQNSPSAISGSTVTLWSYENTFCTQRKKTDFIQQLFLCVFCTEKGILVASLKSDWTTDGRWTILTIILFWALTVVSKWDNPKPPGFHLKYLKRFSEDERSFYRFGRTWG